MALQSKYQIAGISIIVDAPIEIIDNEGFKNYRVNTFDNDTEPFIIRMIEETRFQLPDIQGQPLFQNEMHLILNTKEGLLHYFRIPYTKGICAYNWMKEGNEVEIHYHAGARNYFQNAVGPFNIAGFERVLYHYRKYLFHCSYIDVDGQAVLFSAPSGGGKTTQALLWEKYENATIINGDRGVLEKKEDGYVVHGLPIAGSSGVFVNSTLPLKTIFVVKQAPLNRVTRLDVQEAFEKVFSEITLNNWNQQFVLDAVDFAMALVQIIPIYELECTISKEAVDVVKEVLKM